MCRSAPSPELRRRVRTLPITLINLEPDHPNRSNSNLVLTADRDKRRPADEATGEVESLHGKLGTQRMGDKATAGSGGAEVEEKLKKAKAKVNVETKSLVVAAIRPWRHHRHNLHRRRHH